MGVSQPRGPESPASTEAYVKNGGKIASSTQLTDASAELTEPCVEPHNLTFTCNDAWSENCLSGLI